MEFRIADTFTDSLVKLTGPEQKAVKTTAFDLQMNPANPGLKFHRLDRVKDPNFWSVRVNADIRLIVHKTYSSLMLCYVDHHDKAYSWAERRKLTIHPKTGAAQLVEVRELVKEIIVPRYVEEEQAAPVSPPLFSSVSDEELLSYGVPEEWLEDARLATEGTYSVWLSIYRLKQLKHYWNLQSVRHQLFRQWPRVMLIPLITRMPDGVSG